MFGKRRNMQLVDSHCHLDLLDLSAVAGGVDSVIEDAKAQGVQHLLNVSVSLDKVPDILAPAKRFDNVFASVGLHPNEQPGFIPTVEEIVALADDKCVVAIGETGLDYYRADADTSWQQTRFRHHIRAAKACEKPLIIHTRQARKDTLEILSDENARDIGGVMHCFSEDWEMAQAAIEMNFYISFSGIVTFKNATTLQEVAKQVPLTRMLVETDSPYLAPVPLRGKPNVPANVYHVAAFIAQLREVPIETIAKATTENFFNLFKCGETN